MQSTKMFRHSLLLFIILCSFKGQASDQTLRVGLLGKDKLYQCNFKVNRGTYRLYADGKLLTTLQKNQKVHFSFAKKVTLQLFDSTYSASKFQLIGEDYVNHFSLGTQYHKNQLYDDNLEISLSSNSLKIVNEVNLENYVSSVVEGEAGYRLPSEFYKLQAILSRTYALKNIDRHSGEGFSVCDKVHCQVYHHKCTKDDIYEATIATNSLVVVDDELKLINTIFHSNCGGETCNSEDVWNQKLSYLRCVQDTFCLQASSALWEKTLPTKRLHSYFGRYNVKKTVDNDMFTLCQVEKREDSHHFLSVPLTKVRRDLKLRSTYFYIEEMGDSAKLYGRGYGHGVGLCQQGGMEMANRGYGYVDILKHYYKGIHTVNRKALKFFKE
jgi:stage II sporulation protein D